MSTPQTILPNVTRGFTDFYRMNILVQNLATALGYTYQRRELILPEVSETPAWAATLQMRLQTLAERVGLGNEQARREIIVGPILTEIVLHTDAEMEIEFPIRVSDQLHGTLDYFLTQKANLLVVEAKKGDPTRGMNQLLAEMAALDAYITEENHVLWGALTLGNVWQFAVLERSGKIWTQDTAVFAIPNDLPFLARVLTAILTGIAPQLSPTRP